MNARDIALLALDAADLPGWRTGLLHHRSADRAVDPRDRGLAEQIRIGVIKNLLLLQHLTAHHAGRPLNQLDPLAQKILAIGMYQLRFLQRIPPSAAVNEAVEQTRRFGRPRAAGLVNAVLRNATRRDPAPAMPPDVEWSHPLELFRRLESLVGPEQAVALARHNNAEPPTIVRLFPGADLTALFTEGVEVRPHGDPGLLVVSGAKQHHFAAWAAAGVAQVQDPTAARVAAACDVRPGHSVLDRCAGRGTKTLQLLEAVGDAGRVVAMDAAPDRCADLVRLAQTRGLRNLSVLTGSSMPPDAPRFDRILLDVPCSNSGVLARRPEARYAQNDRALHSVEALQRRILSDTFPHVRPGGWLIYSTCSIWPEENQQQVNRFLAEQPGFVRIAEQATLPSTGDDANTYHDGGYFAVLANAI